MGKNQFTAICMREGDSYVALCPELDIASQGKTEESAMANLKEAVGLFLKTADPSEIEQRLHDKIPITTFKAVIKTHDKVLQKYRAAFQRLADT